MDYRTIVNLIESFINEENLQNFNRTYGLEFEVCIDKEKLLEKLKGLNYDPTKTKGLLASNYGSWHDFLKVQGFGNWDGKMDGSISTSKDGDVGYEFASPILSGEEGLTEIKRFLDFLASIGAYVNESCGGHIHIGAKDLITGDMKKDANKIMIGILTTRNFKPLLHALVPQKRRNDYYAKDVNFTNTNATKVLDIIKKSNDLEDLLDVATGGSRYKSINFLPLSTYGTIEFRIFDGTLNYKTIEERIKFGIAYVNYIAQAEIDIIPLINQMKFDSKELFKKQNVSKNKNLKRLLQQIYEANRTYKQYAVERFSDLSSAYSDAERKVRYIFLKAFSEYPLYTKVVDLSEHYVAIDFRTKQYADIAQELLESKRYVYTRNGTKIKVSTLLSQMEINHYKRNLLDLVLINDYGQDVPSSLGLTPEEFLSKLDQNEAAPYIASLEAYKNEPATT